MYVQCTRLPVCMSVAPTVCMSACACVRPPVCMSVAPPMGVFTCVYIRPPACIHTHTHTHTHCVRRAANVHIDSMSGDGYSDKYTHRYTYIRVYTHTHGRCVHRGGYTHTHTHTSTTSLHICRLCVYGVAMASRIDKIIGLFCRILSLL